MTGLLRPRMRWSEPVAAAHRVVARGEVAQVVEADHRQPGAPARIREMAGERRRRVLRVHSPRRPTSRHGRSGRRASLPAPAELPGLEDRHKRRGDRHHSLAPALRGPLVAAADRDEAPPKVDVGPAEAAELSAAQARVSGRRKQGRVARQSELARERSGLSPSGDLVPYRFAVLIKQPDQ